VPGGRWAPPLFSGSSQPLSCVSAHLAMESSQDADTAQFLELQREYVGASNTLKQIAQQSRARDQERQRCMLTLSELHPLPDDTTLYRGLGRACVSSREAAKLRDAWLTSFLGRYVQAGSKAEVLAELHGVVSDGDDDIKLLRIKAETVEKKARNAEEALQTLLKSNEALARKILSSRPA